MAVALDRFDRARYPRHVLVVITDGADQHSRLRLDDVLRAVQGSQSQVYLVGFFDPKEDAVFRDSGKTVTLVSGREIDNPRYVFKRLAEESAPSDTSRRLEKSWQQRCARLHKTCERSTRWAITRRPQIMARSIAALK